MTTINRITDSWLRATDNMIPPRIESPVDRAYKLGLAILAHVFGVDWRDANVFHARKGFLKNVTGANTPLEREIHKMRIVLLAEIARLQSDVAFAFRQPTGVKKDDYDLTIT